MTDRDEIQDLIYTYSHLYDSGEFDKFAQLFEDATLNLTGVPLTGPDQVRKHIDDTVILYDGKPRTRHLVSNSLIEIAPDCRSATAKSYVTVVQGVADSRPITTVLSVLFNDEFVNVSGGWRFKSRSSGDVLIGDISGHIRLPAS